MCLLLYLATSKTLSPFEGPEISIQLPDPERASLVRQWTSLNNIYIIGSRNGCGCDFPYVISDPTKGALDWDWRSEEPADPASTTQVKALAELIHSHLGPEAFELLPIQDLTESKQPRGKVEIQAASFVPETFYFNEGYLYQVAAAAN